MNFKHLLPLIIYTLFIFIISFYSHLRRKKTEFLKDYFINNRSMGGIVFTMCITTAYVSAGSFIGGPGAAYKYGLGWVLLSLVQVPTVFLSLGILGKKCAILARKYQAITLNDILYARYQNNFIIWISSFTLLLTFMGTITAQYIGGARLLETSIGVPYNTGLIFFSLVTTTYTIFGGFRAGTLNDTMQGILMLFGTLILVFFTVHAAGGLNNAMNTLNHIDPKLLSPTGAENILSPSFVISFWLLACFGVIGLPHTAVSCISYKDSKSIHCAIVLGTLVITIMVLGMHFAGAIGRAVIPDIKIPDQVIPTLIIKVLPPFAAGIFITAPMAAIMSTVNAQLLQSSATIIKDIYLRNRPQAMRQEKKLSYLTKIAIIGMSILLLITSWWPPDMLIWLNLLSLGGLEAVFLWPLVLGLYYKKANAKGAICSMLVGMISYAFITVINFQFSATTLHPIIPSILLSLIAFLLGNQFNKYVLTTTISSKINKQ